MSDRVFITNADYPLTIEIPFPKISNPRIVPLLKIKDFEDPVTRDSLEFPTEDTWLEMYSRLEKLCVSCCPNGHAISFHTFCRMLRDDDWDISNLSNIVKIKCPMCRVRYLVHETMLTLAYTFNSLQDAVDPSKEKNLDHVPTYFSTIEDEDSDDDNNNIFDTMIDNDDDDDDDETQ